ncbi:MAG: methionyl-tRNA formyltransferase [Firmicutes bacterium]|nr:methionyl-tRNA formyltransferase [Bacillota bacterium]
MKVAFFGSPAYALPCLEALVEEEDMDPVLVVTQPDRVRGRKKEKTPTPVKAYALDQGLEVIAPEDVNSPESIRIIKEADPTVLVVIAYGQMIGKELRQTYGEDILNLHGSLLPKYRGASPIQAALLNGEEETGVSAMIVRKGLDAGEVLARARIKIHEEDDLESLEDRLSLLSADLMVEVLRDYEGYLEVKEDQDESLVTKTRKVTKEDAYLDFTKPAKDLVNHVRALKNWPGAKFDYLGKTYKVHGASALEGAGPEEPGTLISVEKNGLGVRTGEGIFLITSLQAPGKKAMAVGDFLNGNPLEAGVLFQGKGQN